MSSLSLSGFQVPTTGRVSSVFWLRTHPVTGEKDSMHNGIDIAAPEGSPVLAARAGKIEAVNQNSETGGKIIYIRHDDGTQTRYMHLSKILIDKVGLRVYARTAIGLVGHTGRSKGDHLHFEVRDQNGNAVDPGPLFGLKETAQSVALGAALTNVPLSPVLIFGLMFGGLLLMMGARHEFA